MPLTSFKNLVSTLRFIANHPLSGRAKRAAFTRYIRWQIGSRLVPGPVSVPLVGDVKLLVSPGMTGATGNIYCGLHEFADMGFVLHVLNDSDLFLDVGANVGVYSMLAAATGASVLAIEPVPAAFGSLQKNIDLNALQKKIEARCIAAGATNGELLMTSNQDTMNHVLAKGQSDRSAISIPVVKLDDVAGLRCPVLMKIDVEGFEQEVLAGSREVLANDALKAVIIELNGSGERHGVSDDSIHATMHEYGFLPHAYDPLTRTLDMLASYNEGSGNTLYLRNIDDVEKRVKAAPKYRVAGQEV